MPGLASALWGAGKAWGKTGMLAGKLAWTNPMVRSAAYGAGIGGLAGGLFSDQGNTFSGAAKGALAGAALGGYGRRLAMLPAMRAAGAGMGFGGHMAASAKIAGAQMWSDAKMSGRFIGRTATKAYNGFRGIF